MTHYALVRITNGKSIWQRFRKSNKENKNDKSEKQKGQASIEVTIVNIIIVIYSSSTHFIRSITIFYMFQMLIITYSPKLQGFFCLFMLLSLFKFRKITSDLSAKNYTTNTILSAIQRTVSKFLQRNTQLIFECHKFYVFLPLRLGWSDYDYLSQGGQVL